jgi:hypothetical protein
MAISGSQGAGIETQAADHSDFQMFVSCSRIEAVAPTQTEVEEIRDLPQ